MSNSESLTQQNNKKQEKGLVHLALGAAGIYASYVILAIFSQKLYNSKYESNVQFNQDGTGKLHEFTHPNLIVWLSGLFCAIFGQFRTLFTGQRKNPISTKESVILGVLFAVNMTATNFALLYISYPTQVIARNSRYLFVVLVGSFLSRVPHKDDLKLPKHKLYVALLITSGVLMFNMMKSGSADAGDHHAFPEEWKGYILLLLSMVADALFCDSQAYSKSVFKPTANHLFTTANFFAFIMSVIYALATDSFFPGLKFIFQHPQCLKQLGLVCILQVTGQVSIYYIVANFKQHIFPLISATRKIITIVCSILIFNHTLNYLQWIAVGIVFAGMVIQVYQEISQKRNGKDNKDMKIIKKQTTIIKKTTVRANTVEESEELIQKQILIQSKEQKAQ